MRNTNTKKWFRNWANEYDRTLGKLKRHHDLLDLVVRSSCVTAGETVLDVGCGTGLLTLKFLKAADCQVTGVDNSPVMLEIFKRKINPRSLKGKIAFRKADASALPFADNSFDVIASTVTLHHVVDKYPVIKKIHNILKPGGRFVIGDLDLDTTGQVTDVVRLSRVMDYLKAELTLAAKDGGEAAISRMFDNGKKHLFNDGEYCISFKQWSQISRKAGFRKIIINTLPGFKWFKVMVAFK